MIKRLKNMPLAAFASVIIGFALTAPLYARKGAASPFGPTGIHGELHPGWPKNPVAIKVSGTGEGSPAEGKLKEGDIIVGIGDEKFPLDPRISLGLAIDRAETVASGGRLPLLLEDGRKVTIKLPALGTYSPTAPYDCPKTDKIIEQAVETILKRQQDPRNKIGRSPTRTDLLGLMATGEQDCIELVGKLLIEERVIDVDPAKIKGLFEGGPDMGLVSWGWGYNLITLGEYYLLTKDDRVLQMMRPVAIGLARGQDVSGCWGHRMVTEAHGGRLPGYAQINQPSISCFMGLLIARKCGIQDPILDKAIERSALYVADHAYKGMFPYGVGGPVINFNNNGMAGTAAVCMSLMGKQKEAKYFSQCAATSHDNLLSGHASAFFNPLWTPLGAGLSGPEVTHHFFRNSLWYFNAKRHWEGGFPGVDNVGSFAGQALLMYCLPRKALLITGREADPSIWLSGNEAKSVVMLSQIATDEKSNEELIEAFSHPFPQVANAAARILMNRTGKYVQTQKKDDFSHKIMAVIDNGTAREKSNALAFFGSRKCHSSFAGPCLEKIAAILRDGKEPFVVRLAAAKALGSGAFPEKAKPYYNDVLKLVLEEDRSGTLDDPFRLIDRELGEVLRGICPHPIPAGLVTDKDLFYQVANRLLDHNRQKARSVGMQMLKGIPLEDFSRVSDVFMIAAHNNNPEFQSYHAVHQTVAHGLEVLADLKIEEGLEILVDTVMSPSGKWGFKRRMFYQTLPIYGGNAKACIPKLEQHQNIPGRGKDLKNWENLVKAIEEDKEPQELISLAEAIASGTVK